MNELINGLGLLGVLQATMV